MAGRRPRPVSRLDPLLSERVLRRRCAEDDGRWGGPDGVGDGGLGALGRSSGGWREQGILVVHRHETTSARECVYCVLVINAIMTMRCVFIFIKCDLSVHTCLALSIGAGHLKLHMLYLSTCGIPNIYMYNCTCIGAVFLCNRNVVATE